MSDLQPSQCNKRRVHVRLNTEKPKFKLIFIIRRDCITNGPPGIMFFYLTIPSKEFEIGLGLSINFLIFLHCVMILSSNMSHDARKPVFGVSDQARHHLSCTVTDAG